MFILGSMSLAVLCLTYIFLRYDLGYKQPLKPIGDGYDEEIWDETPPKHTGGNELSTLPYLFFFLPSSPSVSPSLARLSRSTLVFPSANSDFHFSLSLAHFPPTISSLSYYRVL
jgi:hypothetical protein